MAGTSIWVTLFAFSTIFVVQVISASETYKAAVLEYFPVFLDKSETEESAVGKNVKNYLMYMNEASVQGAEIIVFPEGGLRTTTISSPIPEPYKKISPCDDKSFITTQHVRDLSCGAKKSKIYSVVNLLEKRDCDKKTDEDCPKRGFYIYNTNVVFDKNGTVIARYAKFNLFDESLTNKTKEPEISFFDTTFGVRFGTFTCFDILFGTPTLQMVKQFGITDFVFPTFWFSELPFLTALQAQRGWAETNNVNLLASGVNFPLLGSGGSGIYNGKYGSLVETMPDRVTTSLLVANVPKMKQQNTFIEDEYFPETVKPLDPLYSNENVYNTSYEGENDEAILLHDQIHLYNSAVIQSGKSFEQKLCSRNNFCCNFKVHLKKTTNKTTELVYRAVVSDGVRMYGETATGGVQCCGVIICNGPHLQNCTSRTKNLPGVYKIEDIFVEGEFLKTNSFQMPTTLTDGKKLAPLPASHYVFKKEEKERSVKVSLDLVWPSSDLHTFAIYGRDFTRDGNPPTQVISNAPLTKATVTLISFVTYFFLFAN